MRTPWIRWLVLGSVGVIAAFAASIPPARACSFAGNQPYLLDPQAQATDGTPPGAPVVSVESIHRGRGAERSGCGAISSSCDDLGTIQLQVSATDDQAETASLGYRVELASGALPPGLTLPSTAVRPANAVGLLFVWIDGASDDQEAFSFVLSVRAVDPAGNEGPPTSVEVSDPGSGGCSMSGRASNADALLVMLVVSIGWLVTRRNGSR